MGIITQKSKSRDLLTSVISFVAASAATQAFGASGGGWIASVGYNNPPGANIGVNLCHVWSNFAIEFGLGSMDANSTKKSAGAALGGDFDVKYFFGSSWRPYLEAGLGLAVGAGLGSGGGVGAAAAGPFVGGGIAYHGSKVVFYVGGDFHPSPQWIHPALGIGVRF